MAELVEWKPEDGCLVMKVKFDKPINDLRDPQAVRFMRIMHIIAENKIDKIFQDLMDASKQMHDAIVNINHTQP